MRTPELKRFAKILSQSEDVEIFLNALPHQYFDENQLQAFIIAEIKNFDQCLQAVNHFLPYIDNWATCDQLSPKVFKKNPQLLLGPIKVWINSQATYSIRFAISMLMKHFLDDNFNSLYPEMIAQVDSQEYYVKMMIAWYFATALAKQYDQVLPYIQSRRLDAWTHNKAIQTAIESKQITSEKKEYLKRLKIRSK